MDNNPEQGTNQPQGFDIIAVAQLVSALIAGNTIGYPRLQMRLEELRDVILSGNKKNAQQQVAGLIKFIKNYNPIDKKNNIFLRQYGETNADLLIKLQQAVGEPKKLAPALKPAPKSYVNSKKIGLYRFPFYSYEKLNLGNVADFKTIPQQLNVSSLHFKLWKDINGIPFLVNGYPDDDYSCVTRVLASQAGKLLGLQCEEVFFGNLDSKPVTLTAFHEAVTLLENETFKLYPMASNYEYQSEQKRAFYFLIQHWTAYAVINSQVKERFERHFIDSKGNIFLSQHEFATFLTPQQMSPALMVRLTIDKMNYRPIKDLIIRVGDRDIADTTFSSIPVEMIEAHDELAEKFNKPSFDQRRQDFDSNFERLKEALKEFESKFGM
jgi:hypothetical protein